jgi:hypothetical protein
VLTAIGTLRPTGRRPAYRTIYGAEGSRTPDLCSAIAALSQLSYSPEKERAALLNPVALRSFNDTTPLARGRTVDTKSTRASPEVNQSYARRTLKFHVTPCQTVGSRPAAVSHYERNRGPSRHRLRTSLKVRSEILPYGSSAAPNVGRGEEIGVRDAIEGMPSRLTETGASRSWKRGAAA